MFSKTVTKKSTKNYWDKINQLQTVLNEADAIVIGAGAGLSASAGFDYTGARFDKYFSRYKAKYGFDDMYYGGFYPYQTQEEYWAYWARYITINRYMDAPKPVYNELLALVEDKDYFVLTTNVDHQFQKAGFDKKRLFYMQGDYGLFQCSKPCHNRTYDNAECIKEMYEKQLDLKIPSELIPKCPLCGAPMAMNLRTDNTFVQDRGWYRAAAYYEDFIKRHKAMKTLFLELGVGGNTPVIIKYPFWKLTAENSNAVYACINYGEAICPAELERQSICINDDIGVVLASLQ